MTTILVLIITPIVEIMIVTTMTAIIMMITVCDNNGDKNHDQYDYDDIADDRYSEKKHSIMSNILSGQNLISEIKHE